MGSELRIEREDAVRAAVELAALLKMSVSDAVAEALHERLERKREVLAQVEDMLALGREIRAHMKEPLTTLDINAMLYGPDGLPA